MTVESVVGAVTMALLVREVSDHMTFSPISMHATDNDRVREMLCY